MGGIVVKNLARLDQNLAELADQFPVYLAIRKMWKTI